MAQATFLTLVNDVLKRLREPVCTATTDTAYSVLIGIFVNEAKREVEDAWQWSALRSTIDLSMVVAQRNYTLTGSSNRTKFLGVYNTSSKWQMKQYMQNDYLNNLLSLTTAASASPYEFDVVGTDSATGSLTIRVNPLPTATDTIRFFTINPQADFTSDSTTLLVPKDPVIQLAYLKAINERGEDAGRASEIQEKIYLRTLGDAIAQDEARYGGETTWQAV